ncbi:MAG: phosphoribosylanthranilate isomerase [Ignavibacteriaceae bacterium]|nr:phosphoribosylanthranilate isomerase [Ignavibacteriaceae bacterium]
MRVRICRLDKEKLDERVGFMPDLKVKICGITNLDDALLAEELGADALGFVYYKKSKRNISPSLAAEIISSLSPFTLKVGVFVNSTAGEINNISAQTKINLVQLHGNEQPELIDEINMPVLKAFRIDENFDFNIVEKYNCAGYLFDSFSGDEYGGTGKSFDWDLLPVTLRNKITLAGGIGLESLPDITKINPAAIDLSSSLEAFPGKKDENKIRQFFKEFNKYRSR